MLSGLSYTKKNKFLLGAVLVMGLLVYMLAIKNTIRLRSECNELEKKSILISGIPQRIGSIKREMAEMETNLGGRKDTTLKLQDMLLGAVSSYSKENGTVLREFPRKAEYTEGEFNVGTYTFTAEGTFIKLVKLLYLLEQQKKIGKIASADFQSKRDLKTKQLSLTATVYIQDIRKLDGTE